MSTPTQREIEVASATADLIKLADACDNGACNPCGLAISLGRALDKGGRRLVDHQAFKIVLGQLSFLVGESVGPSGAAQHAWETWKDANLKAVVSEAEKIGGKPASTPDKPARTISLWQETKESGGRHKIRICSDCESNDGHLPWPEDSVGRQIEMERHVTVAMAEGVAPCEICGKGGGQCGQ